MFDSNTEYNIKVILDDITFMAFDLERGGFIDAASVTDIGDGFTLNYSRELISEEEVNGWINIISDFSISATKNGNEFLKFDVRGELRKFTLFNIEGFVSGMFLNQLDVFRKSKFGINT